MKYLIVIIIVAIVVFGIYKTKKKGNNTDGTPGGGVSSNENPVHGNEPVEPRPDDEEHENNERE